MSEPEEELVVVFHYPPIYKWLFGFFTLLFVFLSVVSSPFVAASGILLSAFFLAFAALEFYLWWMLQGHVVVGQHSITLHRFGRSTRIEWAEIRAVRDLALEDALVIEADGRRIRVEKQLERYPLFHEYVSSRLPPLSTGLPPNLPLEVRTRTWVRVMAWLSAIGGLLLLGLALSLLLHGSDMEEVASVALFGILTFPLGVYGFTKNPHRYSFYVDRVEAEYPWGWKVFPIGDLRSMRLEDRAHGVVTSLYLVLAFHGGQIELRDVAVDYPPEALARVLTAKYLPEEDAYDPADGERVDGVGEDERPRVQMAPAVAGPGRAIRVRRATLERWLLAIGALLSVAAPELARALLSLLRRG